MEYLAAYLPQCHLPHCSGSALRCCCARSAVGTNLQKSSSWPHLSQGMMYVLCSFLFTMTLFIATTSEVCKHHIYYCLFVVQENYDEEIEAYKHHLEQTYKLCPPCQAAVDYYIKYQNRQLRTVLLSHHLRRTQDTIKDFIKVQFKTIVTL